GRRVTGFNTSRDGVKWNEWQVIAQIEKGQYQISRERNGKVSVAFNYHPDPNGLNWRTNLYYLETSDFGKSWQTAAGDQVNLPLTSSNNPALVKDFESEGLKCYLKDIGFDNKGNPIIMVISSKGYESGPANDPRKWELFYFHKNNWSNKFVTTSDNNYDMGSLYIDSKKVWQIIAPTERGPQHYNPGGEIVVWETTNRGNSWYKGKQLTTESERNNN